MFDKIFGHDELHKELEEAKEQILTLQSEILIKDLKIKSQSKEIEALRSENVELKEKLDIKKFSPDRFGRISRATERNLNILREMQQEGLSFSKIAKKMTDITGEDWSKSTVHYLLKRHRG